MGGKKAYVDLYVSSLETGRLLKGDFAAAAEDPQTRVETTCLCASVVLQLHTTAGC